MKERKMMISQIGVPQGAMGEVRIYPSIHLFGEWLEILGFHPGKEVWVRESMGHVELVPAWVNGEGVIAERASVDEELLNFEGEKIDENGQCTPEYVNYFYKLLVEAVTLEAAKNQYLLCMEIRERNRVVYRFPKIPCSGLILDQLRMESLRIHDSGGKSGGDTGEGPVK